MGSHQDRDHGQSEILRELTLKAELMSDLGKNRVANSKVVRQWAFDGVRVQELPEDDHGVLRVSIGGHPDITPSEYCNFRGDQGRVIQLLERCLSAMKSE